LIDPRNVSRQLADIQAQAERLLQQNADMIEIRNFSLFAQELKSYLVSYVRDEFVLQHIKEIPDLIMNKLDKDGSILTVIAIALAGVGIHYLITELRRKRALAIIRDMKSKYASITILLENYFDE